MTDIVERLRMFKTGCDKPECKRLVYTPLVCEEAADEIERMRKALHSIAKEYDGKAVADVARAALEGK